MNKRKFSIILLLLISCGVLSLHSETLFLYVEESCDDGVVPLEESVREGILEILFDAGHIVFDDISCTRYELAYLLNQAKGFGAMYLISVSSRSSIVTEGGGSISAQTEYALYRMQGGDLLGKGALAREMKLQGTVHSRVEFWYKLGVEIGENILQIIVNKLMNSSDP